MSARAETNWKKFFKSRWFFLVMAVMLFVISFAYIRAYYRDYQIQQEINRLQEEVKRLEAKKIETGEVLKYVKSSDFIEEKARIELNLVKPGEQVAVIDGGKISTNTTGQENKKMIKFDQLSNPIKWWIFFTQK
ncbi:MAG: septum formation initiator family protein [Candidatus Magasanikbacteria bacterium]